MKESVWIGRIREQMQQHGVPEGARVLVAMSGGPDSVWLGWSLRQAGYPIGLAHVNYKLRGADSEADAALVEAYARTWEVPLYQIQEDPHDLAARLQTSLQAAARKIRYDFVARIMETEGYAWCATGHQAGDQAETILMSLLRGNSPRVLRSIPARRAGFIRPLLPFSRAEIITGLTEAGLTWRQDQSNEQTDYLRNQIRHTVLPPSLKINPDGVQQLINRSEWYTRQHTLIRQLALEEAKAHVVTAFGIPELALEPLIQRWGHSSMQVILAEILTHWGAHGHDVWAGVDLADREPGRYHEGTTGRILRTRAGLAWISAALLAPEPPVSLDRITAPQTLHISGHTMTLTWYQAPTPMRLGGSHLYYMDYDAIQWPLTIRRWEPGDRMIPFGMRTSKKISDILTDQKAGAAAKFCAIVAEDQAGIVWLSGFRIAARVQVQPATRQVLLLSI
ncbi:MAG: tRNA lysidine(34) synthetase TilS [Bacteroidia bacterium]|nr:tRNA lysidine(34) synthetase TilS [Bacteroidia bacterium]